MEVIKESMKKTAIFCLIMLLATGCSHPDSIENDVSASTMNIESTETELKTALTKYTTEIETQTTTGSEQRALSLSDMPVTDVSEYKVIDCPYISQELYPTGCEIISLTMLLNANGIEISTDELMSELEYSPLKVVDNNLYGGDPNKKFIGNPVEDTGFGCYNGVIEELTTKVFNKNKIKDYYILKLNNESLDDLCYKCINKDIPVMIWASIGMVETYEDEQYQWIIEDENVPFQWISNEHCLLLTGYDSTYYYFNDPLAGKNITYSKEIVQQRYNELGKQAFTIVNKEQVSY